MKYCAKCGKEFEDWAGECPDCRIVLVYEMPAEDKLGFDYSVKTVVVYRSNKQRDIEIAKNLLEASGVRFTVKGLESAFPMISSMFGMKILVDEKDRDEAEKALANLKKQG